MATVTEHDQYGTGAHDPQRPGSGSAQKQRTSFPLRVGDWQVKVQIGKYQISRTVHHRVDQEEIPWPSPRSSVPEVIWPTWPTNLVEEKATAGSPLANLEQHWDATTTRLRDSAKWMAAVLGAALAAVIPTAPLADLNQRHISVLSAVLGLCGLLSLSITMLLILRVLRPLVLPYDKIENATSRGWGWLGSPSYRWKAMVTAHPDLYLPCQVGDLSVLRQSVTVEEMTLMVLVRATEHVDDATRKKLEHARAARAARLYEVRGAAASIVTIGVFYAVRARSTWATLGGAAFGLLGLILVIAAVTGPIK
jgi:hypothetical protein